MGGSMTIKQLRSVTVVLTIAAIFSSTVVLAQDADSPAGDKSEIKSAKDHWEDVVHYIKIAKEVGCGVGTVQRVVGSA